MKRSTVYLGTVALSFAAIVPIPAQPQQPVDLETIVARCVSCHGQGGVSTDPDIPNLAGQHTEYLVKQLHAFQYGGRRLLQDRHSDDLAPVNRRSNPHMSSQSFGLDDDQINTVAAYFSSQPCQSGHPENAPVSISKIERCAVCHGATGISHLQDVPKLAGQKKNYMVEQLTVLRDHARAYNIVGHSTLRSSSIMETQAFTLTNGEIDNLASYFAAQSCSDPIRR